MAYIKKADRRKNQYQKVSFDFKLSANVFFPQSLPTGTLRFATISIIFTSSLRFNQRLGKSWFIFRTHKSATQLGFIVILQPWLKKLFTKLFL